MGPVIFDKKLALHQLVVLVVRKSFGMLHSQIAQILLQAHQITQDRQEGPGSL